jgi:hypothetical protein
MDLDSGVEYVSNASIGELEKENIQFVPSLPTAGSARLRERLGPGADIVAYGFEPGR